MLSAAILMATAGTGFTADWSVSNADLPIILVRPCERWAGDGLSGLPRMRVTGDCCGDGNCSGFAEDDQSCPQDCTAAEDREKEIQERHSIKEPDLGGTAGMLFGELQQEEEGGDVTRDKYHCERQYDTDGSNHCSHSPQRQSAFLDSLLDRAGSGELPFALPQAGAKALELGCGLGQDGRNMARQAGWAVTSVDVSARAIERAKRETPVKMLGSGPGQVQFHAHDALALPPPQEPIDFIFDATVYCALRYRYLARVYSMWRRLITPNHTLVLVQCWRLDHMLFNKNRPITPMTWRDMAADFEPVFDIVHSEKCDKNQDNNEAWCFFLKLKELGAQEQIIADRLALQHAARSGDSKELQRLLGNDEKIHSAEAYQTLQQISEVHGHTAIIRHLGKRLGTDRRLQGPIAYDASPADLFTQEPSAWVMTWEFSDILAAIAYGFGGTSPYVGRDGNTKDVLEAVDRFHGGNAGKKASKMVQRLRSRWEQTEMELQGLVVKGDTQHVVATFRNPHKREHVYLFWRSPEGKDKMVLVISPERESSFLALPGEEWLLYAGLGPQRRLIKRCIMTGDAIQHFNVQIEGQPKGRPRRRPKSKANLESLCTISNEVDASDSQKEEAAYFKLKSDDDTIVAEGLADLQQIVHRTPSRLKPHLEIVSFLAHRGETIAAGAHLLQMHSHWQDCGQKGLVSDHHLASVYARMGGHAVNLEVSASMAMRFFDEALRLDQASVEAWHGSAYAMLKLPNEYPAEQVVSRLRTALQHDPGYEPSLEALRELGPQLGFSP